MNFSDNFSINKKGKGWVKFLVGAVALFIFIAILNFFNSPIKNSFFIVSSPLQKTLWTAGESSAEFFSSFANAGNLKDENQNLKNENQKLQSELAALYSIVNGNQAQSDVSASCQNNGFNLQMAGVIGLDNQDILSLNKGSVDGISENMPVISQQGSIYGKIYKVYKNFSQVMLISHKNSVINVRAQRQDSEIDGVVKGLGNFSAFLDLVSIDDNLNEGDILTTSSLEKTFPKDLLVGVVGKIEKNDQSPHQTAQVAPFLNSSIDNLFIITNYKR